MLQTDLLLPKPSDSNQCMHFQLNLFNPHVSTICVLLVCSITTSGAVLTEKDICSETLPSAGYLWRNCSLMHSPPCSRIPSWLCSTFSVHVAAGWCVGSQAQSSIEYKHKELHSRSEPGYTRTQVPTSLHTDFINLIQSTKQKKCSAFWN